MAVLVAAIMTSGCFNLFSSLWQRWSFVSSGHRTLLHNAASLWYIFWPDARPLCFWAVPDVARLHRANRCGFVLFFTIQMSSWVRAFKFPVCANHFFLEGNQLLLSPLICFSDRFCHAISSHSRCLSLSEPLLSSFMHEGNFESTHTWLKRILWQFPITSESCSLGTVWLK